MGTGNVDRAMLREAAEFARLLELDMLGVFIEDRSLIELAALPFARELRLPGHDWQALEPQRVGSELRAAAEQARRLFRQEIESQGVACSFEVHSGNPAALASSVAQTTDVLIVMEPLAVDMLAPGWEAARRAAIASAAAVLLLPRSGMPRRGPVAAVAASPSDVCFQLASHIAKATGEQVFAIPPEDQASPQALLTSLWRALGPHRERLLVLPRKATMHDEMNLEMARLRQVPILLVRP
jgi:hypothetical protein